MNARVGVQWTLWQTDICLSFKVLHSFRPSALLARMNQHLAGLALREWMKSCVVQKVRDGDKLTALVLKSPLGTCACVVFMTRVDNSSSAWMQLKRKPWPIRRQCRGSNNSHTNFELLSLQWGRLHSLNCQQKTFSEERGQQGSRWKPTQPIWNEPWLVAPSNSLLLIYCPCLEGRWRCGFWQIDWCLERVIYFIDTTLCHSKLSLFAVLK